MKSKDSQELCGIDGEPVEFEWNIFPGHTTFELLESNQKISEFGSSSCRCTMPSIGQEVKNFKKFISNSTEIKGYAHRFPKGHRFLLGPDTKKNGLEHIRTSLKESGTAQKK